MLGIFCSSGELSSISPAVKRSIENLMHGQEDVVTVFLNGELKKEGHMRQPRGFVNGERAKGSLKAYQSLIWPETGLPKNRIPRWAHFYWLLHVCIGIDR